jgi:autoinducer 2-degrading protein
VFVVGVEFTIAPGQREAFLVEMIRNAEVSRSVEAGCRQFDVCVDPSEPDRVVLYEVYDDRAAFDVHCRSEHFNAFNDATAAMIVGKTVDLLQRVSP